MGQYYVLVNLDKQQYLRPHTFGSGAKLLEFACDANGALTALAVLLASGNGQVRGDLRANSPLIGSWAGDRIVVAGDYGPSGLFVCKPDRERYCTEHGESSPNLYAVATSFFDDISTAILDVLAQDASVPCLRPVESEP